MKGEFFTYNGFTGSVETSIEDECMHGKVMFINALVSYEGETIKELRQRFEEAVDDYLETCADQGWEPEKPCSGTFNIRPGADLHRNAILEASKVGESLNEYVCKALKTRIEKGPTEELLVKHQHSHSVHYKMEAPIHEYIERSPWGTPDLNITNQTVNGRTFNTQ